MQRCNLVWVVLQLKALGIENVLQFDFLSPPSAEAMLRALELLYALNVIDDSTSLVSPNGYHVAEFPVEPCLATMLLRSLDFECSEEILTIASMLSVQHVFVHPRGSRALREKVEAAMGTFASRDGDHLTALNVYEGFLDGGGNREWCSENCIHYPALVRAREVRRQLRGHLQRVATASGKRIVSCGNEGTERQRVLRCVVSGFFANAARLGSDGAYRTVRDRRVVAVHPSSVLSKFGAPPEWVVFNGIVLTTQEHIHDVSQISPSWLLELAPHFYLNKASSRGDSNNGGESGKRKFIGDDSTAVEDELLRRPRFR
jgi:ATP-dependent RNA helicase DDX35